MDIITKKYYITRTGDFATDANKKIAYILIGLCLCYHDYIERNTLEYMSVFIGSSLFWTVIELFLNVTKSRIINPMVIKLRKKTKLPVNKYIGIALQGTQEGGVVTIIGLYFGDRSLSMHYQAVYHMLIFYMAVNMISKNSNLTTRSRRQVNTTTSLSIMATATLYNTITMFYNTSHIYRIFTMFLSMIYISSIWTYISYKKMFRDVEIEGIDEKSGEYRVEYSPKKTVFNVLTYDIIFEIGIAYITFYNLFVIHFPIIQ
jgi:hypothetical protein